MDEEKDKQNIEKRASEELDHTRDHVDPKILISLEKKRKEKEEKKAKEEKKKAAAEKKDKQVVGIERLMVIRGWLSEGYEYHRFKKRKLFYHIASDSYHEEHKVVDYILNKSIEILKLEMFRCDPVYDIDDKDIKKAMTVFTCNPKTAVKLERLIAINPTTTRNALHSYRWDLCESPIPTWELIMSRMGNSKAFEAFVWSIFEDNSARHQYCYLYGQGNTGKSTITEFLQTKLGSGAACHTSVKETRSRFFIGKNMYIRLVVVTESEPDFTKTNEFKGLSGESYHLADIKFKDPVTVQVKYKFIFTSNDNPNIGNNFQDKRRIIYCPMAPFTAGTKVKSEILARLHDEWPAILHRCSQSYNDLVQVDGSIKVDHEQIDQEITDEVAGFETMFLKLFALIDYEKLPKEKKSLARMTKADIIYHYKMALVHRKIPDKLTDNEFWRLLRRSELICNSLSQKKVQGKRYWSGICQKDQISELGLLTYQIFHNPPQIDDIV